MITLPKGCLVLLTTLLAVAYNGSAFATDGLLALEVSPSSRITYEPFSGQPGSELLTVNLGLSQAARNNPSNAAEQLRGKQFRIRFRTPDETEFIAIGQQQQLPVMISPAGQPRGFNYFNNEYHQNIVFNGRNLRARKLDFLLSVPESVYAAPDKYVLPLIIDFVDLSNNQVLMEQRVDVEVFVNIRLQANIAGTDRRRGGSMSVPVVDFGVLKTGESRRVSLQVRGNTHAKITVKSQHKGRLRHKKEHDLFIDYSVSVDGTQSSLENPLVLTRDVAKTIQGSAYPMDIKIGDVGGAFAGKYRDTITVEVRPL